MWNEPDYKSMGPAELGSYVRELLSHVMEKPVDEFVMFTLSVDEGSTAMLGSVPSSEDAVCIALAELMKGDIPDEIKPLFEAWCFEQKINPKPLEEQ